MKTKIVLGLATILVALQFFRPEKYQGSPAFSGKNDATVVYPASAEVRQVLAAACYDCHSNRTTYPWYAEIQPVGWWLANHIKDARRELNFSEFGAYSAQRQMRKLENLCDEVRDRKMPLKSYTWLHARARLTDAQITALCQWAEGAQDRIAEK